MTYQTLDDIMRIAIDGQDFNYFVPAPILKHDMKNAKGCRHTYEHKVH